jgi:nucleotide-binding universal stress UspA family protein
MREIVVGTDCSDAARSALEFAGRLCGETGARLTVVNVHRTAPVLSAPVALAPDYESMWQAEERDALDQAAAVLDQLGVDWRLETGTGDPATELDKVADRRHADLIVVSGRGHTMAHRLLLGSVSTRLAHHAGHSVLVVR